MAARKTEKPAIGASGRSSAAAASGKSSGKAPGKSPAKSAPSSPATKGTLPEKHASPAARKAAQSSTSRSERSRAEGDREDELQDEDDDRNSGRPQGADDDGEHGDDDGFEVLEADTTEGNDALDGEDAFGGDDGFEERDEDEESDEDSSEPGEPRRSSVALARPRSDSGLGLARLDPLQAYMREVQMHPLLTPDEEKQLAVRYAETGDVDAAARLVTANLRLVVKLAYEYRRAYRNIMDLVQEGNMGLMQAVKKYDPYRGVKLSSYAAWWIRAYMLRFILANWRMVKLGTTQAQRKLFFNLNKERARLTAMGIEPTNAEIAERLDVSESEVDEMDRRLSRGDASLDTPIDESDGRQTSRIELLPSEGSTPDLLTEDAELGTLLRRHLDEFRLGLAGKDLIIFDERLVADEPRTLQELGDQFGVSRERVRQLEARVTKQLRTFLGARLGDAVEVGRG